MQKRIPEINELDLFSDRMKNMVPSITEQFKKLETFVSDKNLFYKYKENKNEDLVNKINSLPKLK